MNSKISDSVYDVSTGNAVWIATALLHYENKDREAFQNKEIFQKVIDLNLLRSSETTLWVHISSQCVANRKAQPNTHRKLYRIRTGWYRLYRIGDPYDETRHNGRIEPLPEEIPLEFRQLIDWYHDEYCKESSRPTSDSHDTSNNTVFSKVENNKTITLPSDICELLQIDDGDYIAFVLKSPGEILLKKAKMKLEI